jgi:hypothetical protein
MVAALRSDRSPAITDQERIGMHRSFGLVNDVELAAPIRPSDSRPQIGVP